jgi:4-hydroxy-tetrahydrodipicolinate reductase
MGKAIKVGVAGAGGKMGRMLIGRCIQDPCFQLMAAIERPESPLVGVDAGLLSGSTSTGVKVNSNLLEVIENIDILIDFTSPESTLSNVLVCQDKDKPIVIGTTGLGDSVEALESAARYIPIMFAPNMSIGVNICFQVLETVARALGDEFDVEIIEAHHRDKIDSPSGTALRMGEVVAEALGRNLSDCAVYGREGDVGVRESKTIGFGTVRGGDIVGEHTVMFAGPGERIEVTHRASDRSNFANGALKAAKWLESRKPGLYDMQDVLNFR